MDFKALFSKKNTDDFGAGLTVQNGVFKYVLLERGKNGYMISSAISDTFEEKSKENPYGEIFHKLSGFAKNKAPLSVSLPVSETMLKLLYMPMELTDARLSLRYEIENFFPVSSGEAVFDVADVDFPFAEQYEGRHYLAAVARKAKIEALSDAARTYGFSIECVEPAQIAIERAVSLYSGHGETVMFIYAEGQFIQYILFWHNNGIFYRSSYFNNYTDAQNPAGEVSEEFKINVLTKEIRRFLDEAYAETKIAAKSAVLLGPSTDYRLCQALQTQLAPLKFDCLNVMELNSIEMINIDNKNSQWDIPLGLALRHFDV